MLRFVGAAGLTGTLLMVNTPLAHGQMGDPTCGDRDFVTQRLEQKYGESRQGIGLVGDNKMLELWRSTDGTWTVLMTRTDGVTCIVAAGNSWNEMSEPQPKSDPT